MSPTPQKPEEIAAWAESCSRYQRWLLSHSAGRDSPDPDRIREAYRASLTDAPMPDISPGTG